MKRLTQKIKDTYLTEADNACLDYCEQARTYIGGNVLNKLGQLEDIEEKLGIGLITLFKAFTNGFYAKEIHYFKNGEHETIEYYNKPEIRLFEEWYIYYCVSSNYHTIAYKIKDYGKTWSLTREELEKKEV